MKFIQIFVFALVTATMAAGQTSSPSPQPGAKSSGAKPAATASSQGKPAPAAKKPDTAAKKPASSRTSAHAAPAAKPVKPAASATSVKSASARAKGHTNTSSTVKQANAHPQSKPVVATGTLPAKAAPGSSQAKRQGATTITHSAAGPTVSPVPVRKAAGKSAAKLAHAAASKSKTVSKPTVARVPQKPDVAKVEPTKPEPKPPVPAKLLGAAGRRDPFVSPIRNASAVTPQNCASGKRCLAIPELVLQGTVRDVTGKMLAVVSTSNRRTYTLRENDQVYNGSVEKITSDSIIFREFVRDAVGRETAKEVVKKMGPIS